MAVGVENLLNIVSPDATYPSGTFKNNDGGSYGSGTPLNERALRDVVEFFSKALRDNSLTAIDDFDNEDNGYQYTDAVQRYMSAYAGPIMQYLLGSEYDNTKMYVILGCATVADAGIVFYDGNLYYLEGNSGPSCIGPNVMVINYTAVGHAQLKSLSATCGASGSGIIDYADLTREFINLDWVNVGSGGLVAPAFTYNGTTASRGEIRYKKSNIGNVKRVDLDGWVVIDGPSIGDVIFSMPVEYAPDRDTYAYGNYSVGGAACASTIELKIKTSGDVECNQTAASATNYLCLSGISFVPA